MCPASGPRRPSCPVFHPTIGRHTSCGPATLWVRSPRVTAFRSTRSCAPTACRRAYIYYGQVLYVPPIYPIVTFTPMPIIPTFTPTPPIGSLTPTIQPTDTPVGIPTTPAITVTPGPTDTPGPTNTPAPTDTPAPTNTPAPTVAPTDTPAPTIAPTEPPPPTSTSAPAPTAATP